MLGRRKSASGGRSFSRYHEDGERGVSRRFRLDVGEWDEILGNRGRGDTGIGGGGEEDLGRDDCTRPRQEGKEPKERA